MYKVFSQLWFHFVWTTKDREPVLDITIRQDLNKYAKEIAEENKFYLDIINGVEDHLHCLVSLKPTQSVSEVIGLLKGKLSYLINKEISKYPVYWQNGYGAFSVSQTNIKYVRRYIYNQEMHHKNMTFDEEIN